MFWRTPSAQVQARNAAEELIKLAKSSSSRFEQALHYSPAPGEPSFPIPLELIYLSLHLIDRWLFARYGPDKRNDFCDLLVTKVFFPMLHMVPENMVEIPPAMQEKTAEITVRILIEKYNELNLKYANYPELMHDPKQKPFDGSLLWEFSKKLARIYAPQGDQEMIALMLTRILVDYSAQVLTITKTIKL